ncbi:hypothetical protein, partial [Mesorhizobium argentiipisi]
RSNSSSKNIIASHHRNLDPAPQWVRGSWQPDTHDCGLRRMATELGSEERDQPIKAGSALPNSPDDVPYPVPASETEATGLLEKLAAGHALSPGVMKVLRRHMMAGTLTPAMVEQQRKFAA